MKQKNEKDSPVFEKDDEAIYIDFESEDGSTHESQSYLSLRTRKFEYLKGSTESFTLNFDQARVKVTGEKLKNLYDLIGKHKVSILRKGLSTEPDEPSVKIIAFSSTVKEF